MERKKEGWFHRLLPFWKERTEEIEGERIGFFYEQENKSNPFAEMGAVASLTQEETKRLFDEVEKTTEARQTGFFDMREKDEEKPLRMAEEEKTRKSEQRNVELFRGDAFWREERREKEEAEERSVFLREMEMESEKQMISAVKEEAESAEMQETAEIMKKQEEKKAEPAVDIEKLMRQITERLWEEREGCGRKLR
jgi:hypothetical protein